MSRAPSPLIVVVALVSGIALGLLSARSIPSASAQQAKENVAAEAPATPAESAERELVRQYEAFRHVDRVFELVAKIVSPSVVHIVSKKPGEREDGTATQIEESGSGVIVRPEKGGDLCVLTNNHVVDGSSPGEVSIYLYDGRVLRPEKLWADPTADVAVLKLGRDDLPTAKLGDSDEARIGNWVVALGSPFGLTHSVSHGIISARGRHERELEEDGVENQDFLQTDAAINPGNSGGPLVNLKGEVIGINTAIASNGGGSEGVGFSIPINLARWIMVQLVTTGRVSRGAMGVNLLELTPQKAQELGLERPRGARIFAVQDPSPAAIAGLKPNDVVLRFNGSDVVNFNHLINLISMTPIGDAVELIIWRDHRSFSTRVQIADRETILAQAPPSGRPNRAPRAESSPTTALGLELRTLEPETARTLKVPESLKGAAIVRVDPKSPLVAWLQANDVIISVAGKPVETAFDAARALRRPREPQKPLELIFERAVGGAMQAYSVKMP